MRVGPGFAGGVFQSSSDERRENYFALGFGYIRRTESAAISSLGFTPTLYHSWDQPIIGEQNTFGGDIHLSFLKDRLRLGLGARDLSDFDNTWFLTFSILDLPGAA